MKYFTPELYGKLQDFSSDAVMDRADAAWERATQSYRRRLTRIRPELPRGIRSLLENFYLHDADVLGMGERGQTFIVTLRLEAPPNELLILNYHLTDSAVINPAAFAPRIPCAAIQWMYDEVDLVRGKNGVCTHSILFSNGWEAVLRLRDVRVLRTQTLYPVPTEQMGPASASVMSQPA